MRRKRVPKRLTNRLEYIGHIHEDDGTVREVYREVGRAERIITSAAFAIAVCGVSIAAMIAALICLL